MAINPQNLKDLTNQLEMAVKNFDGMIEKTTNFNTLVEDVLLSSSQLQKKFKNVGEIIEKMSKSKRMINKMEKSMLDIKKRQIKEGFAAIVPILRNHLKVVHNIHNQEIQNRILKKYMVQKEQEHTEELKRRLALMKVEASWRHKILESTEKWANILIKTAGGIVFAGLLSGLKVVHSVFSEVWDFLDKKVIPTNAKLNIQFGNMGPAMKGLRKQAVNTGLRFEFLGKTFEEGADAAKGIADAMMTIDMPKDTLETGLVLSEFVGLGAEKAGKLSLQFLKTTGSLKLLNEAMDDATLISREYGIPVNQIRRDVGEFPDILARFGTSNVMQFQKSAAAARSYGLTIGQVNKSFGKSLDTFDATADAAATLNTVFRTNINSLELMMEPNSQKRFEMIRGELVAQGKTWDTLNVAEKNVLTTQLQLSESEAELAFASEERRMELLAQQKEQAKGAKIARDWDKGLQNIKQTLLAWKPLLDMLKREIATVIARFFGWEDATSGTVDVAKILRRTMKLAIRTVRNFGKTIDPKKGESRLGDFKSALDDVQKTMKNFDMKKAIDGITTFGNILDTLVIQPLKLFMDFGESLGKGFSDLFGVTEREREKSTLENMFSRMQKAEQTGEMSSGGKMTLSESIMRQIKGGSFDTDIGKAIQKSIIEGTFKHGSIGLGDAGKINQILTAKDALITKDGKVIKFHPDDNIVATKSPNMARHAAVGGNLPMAMAGIGGSQNINIVLQMDGRTIAEQQVRLARE